MVKVIDYRNSIEESRKVLIRLGLLPIVTGPGGNLITVSSTPTEYTITATAAVAVGLEKVSMRANDNVTLEAGEILTFGEGAAAVTVTVGKKVDFTGADKTADPVVLSGIEEVDVLPLTTAVVADSTATTYALKVVEGLTEGNPDPALSETDISDYQAGKGTRYGVYQYAPTISLVANVIYDSPAHGLLEYMTLNPDYVGLNMYVDMIYQLSGRRIYGVAIVTTSQVSTPVHDRLTINATVAFQGEPTYEAPPNTQSVIDTMITKAKADGLLIRPAA